LSLSISVAQIVALALLFIQYADFRITGIGIVFRTVLLCVAAKALQKMISMLCDYIVIGTAYMQENPGEVLMAVFSGCITWFLMRLAIPSLSEDSYLTSMRSVSKDFYNKIGPWTKLTRFDAEMVSAHEAGHAVVFGLLPYFQKDVEVVMTCTHKDGLDGYCRTNGWNNRSHSMVFLELKMLIALAGVEAEKICTGERTVSGTADYERFIDIAEDYLACGEFELFYHEPKTEIEAAYNRSKVLELRLRLQQVVRNLLIENREILDAIRQKLMDKGRVHGDELTDLLTKVKAVPGCPLISEFLREAMREDVATSDERQVFTPLA
jgi:hypothetical protein